MQKIKSLLTFVLILFAMTARADSGTTTFVRLDDVTQLKPYQQFIIVSYIEGATPQYCALSVRRNNNCEHYTEPVTMGSDGKIVISNDLLDNSTVLNTEISETNPRRICLLRASAIKAQSATSISAVIRMASFKSDAAEAFLDANYALSFKKSSSYTNGSTDIGFSPLCTWTLSNDAYNDYSDFRSTFSENLPTYGCILHADKGVFMKNYQALVLNPTYDPESHDSEQFMDARLFTTDEAFPISSTQEAYDNGISEEVINGTKTRCYNSRILIYVSDVDACTHPQKQVVNEKKATCKEEGRKAHVTCLYCSQLFDRNDSKKEVTLEELIIPKAPHALIHNEASEPTCEYTGVKENYWCSVCYKYFTDSEGTHETDIDEECTIPALGHNMMQVEPTTPTCTTPGIQMYFHCDRCGDDFADFEGYDRLERGQYPIIPSLGHEYADGSTTCSHCGHKAEAYYQAYNYGRVMEDGKCIFVAKIDGKYYTVGNLVNVPSPLEDPRGGRGRGEANTITAYEAIEVTPEADGSIMSSISGLQEFGRELLTPAELQDRFGGWYEGIPAALTLRTNDGYLMEQRRGSNSFGSERDPWQALEVFMPGTWMPEYYYPAQIKAMPLYTTVFQFEGVSVFRFVTINGRLYFTAEHPSLLYEGYDAYNPELSVCHPEYSYYVYTLKPDTPPTSTTPGAPNPYFVLDTDDSGSVDAGDVQNIVNLTIHNILPDDLSKDETIYFDYDGDGNVSIGDVVNYIKLVISGSAGDTPGGTPGISKDPYDGEACSNKR